MSQKPIRAELIIQDCLKTLRVEKGIKTRKLNETIKRL